MVLGSLQLHNTAVSRIEQALSEVASSLSSFSPRPGPKRAWMLQVEVWLLLGELYLALDQPSDVQQCIQEATQIYPLSHHIMHMVCSYLFQFHTFYYLCIPRILLLSSLFYFS